MRRICLDGSRSTNPEGWFFLGRLKLLLTELLPVFFGLGWAVEVCDEVLCVEGFLPDKKAAAPASPRPLPRLLLLPGLELLPDEPELLLDELLLEKLELLLEKLELLLDELLREELLREELLRELELCEELL